MSGSPQILTQNNPADPIPTATGATFKTMVLQRAGPVAVEFMSYGCEHCGTIEPILQQVAEMVKDQMIFCKVNVANDPALGEEFDIRATPTLVMFLRGKPVGRVEGPRPSVSAVLTAVSHPFRTIK